jgi:L-fuconolactonase
MPFDLLVRPQHLGLIPELAGQVPELPMVVDHLAKPPIAQRELEPWARRMEVVSRFPRIHMKISGMVTEADWKTWLPADFKPYVQHVWKLFGPDRCLFGSDWPVCLQAGIWKEVLAAFTQALGPVEKETRAGVMGANAARFYGLRVDEFSS